MGSFAKAYINSRLSVGIIEALACIMVGYLVKVLMKLREIARFRLMDKNFEFLAGKYGPR